MWNWDGVADGTRTHDNRNHNPGLYQLSYSHHRKTTWPVTGLPDRNRTCNPQLRRLVLYPVELRAVIHLRVFGGANYSVVGARGFEPPTSCSQSKRATGLRYAPKDRELCLNDHILVNFSLSVCYPV